MEYEVVVVGGGIGGLTVAAALAARGVRVCLFERQSQVGGCVAPVEHAGYQFAPTFGLYTGWEPDGTYEQLCAELRVTAPPAQLSSPAYVVRLPEGVDIPRPNNLEELPDALRTAFPECADAAIGFYHNFANASDQSTAATHLERGSLRFRTFIEIQLQTLAQCASPECTYQFAASLLDPRQSFWRIKGGVQSLVDLLVESFRRSGGKLRLNSPVLRLAYGSDGHPIGVDLLNGERVGATHGIVSNLTVWDTYGKLIGPSRTPRQVSGALKYLRNWGMYQMFLTMNARLGASVPSCPLLIASGLTPDSASDSGPGHFVFCANSAGATAVVSTYTPAEDWFSFHEDQEAFETRDRELLEILWAQLHTSMPELGDGVELIETATPQTFYEDLRRRFGMIGRPNPPTLIQPGSATPFANMWLVGDTVAAGPGLEGVVESARQLAVHILT